MKFRKKIIKVVILEDDDYYNKALNRYIKNICNGAVYLDLDFDIKSYKDPEDCIEKLEKDTTIMILDHNLSNEELNGLDVFEIVREYCDDCKVIVVSEQQSAHVTAELMRKGVFDYIDKTVSTKNRIGSAIQKALDAELNKPRVAS
ncbi:MAG: response regulator [Crocinitomicaceae bacterium]|nr:response regulator [Crocinitomicaceae bacterium]